MKLRRSSFWVIYPLCGLGLALMVTRSSRIVGSVMMSLGAFLPTSDLAQFLRPGQQVITNRTLPYLATSLDHVFLDLSKSWVTDAGLAHLEGHSEIRALNLDFTDITDVALVHIRTLRNLEELSLNYTKVTGAGLSSLADLDQLRILRIEAIHHLTDSDLLPLSLRRSPELTHPCFPKLTQAI